MTNIRLIYYLLYIMDKYIPNIDFNGHQITNFNNFKTISLYMGINGHCIYNSWGL